MSRDARSWTIDPMLPEDWDEVRRIYLEGIETGHATFETETPSWEAWDAAHRPDVRLVARPRAASHDLPAPDAPPHSDPSLGLLGWAALSPVSSRAVYRGVAEVSVYVSHAARGRGVGRDLLEALIEAAEVRGVWTLQAGIFPENETSVAVHRSLGFREVGRRERLGKLRGVWRDVLLLERRSRSVGAS